MIERRETTRIVCPPDLYREAPARPQPAADAVIRHNDAGGAFLDGVIAWADGLAQILADSRTACEARP